MNLFNEKVDLFHKWGFSEPTEPPLGTSLFTYFNPVFSNTQLFLLIDVMVANNNQKHGDFIYILFEHILKLSSPSCIGVIGGGAGQRVKGPIQVVGIVKVQGESSILFEGLGKILDFK